MLEIALHGAARKEPPPALLLRHLYHAAWPRGSGDARSTRISRTLRHSAQEGGALLRLGMLHEQLDGP